MTGRRGWLVLIVAAVLVFLFFGAGTAYSLLTPDYAFADGELLGEAAILTGSLALAAFGARRLRAPDVRLRDQVPDFGAWLPGREGSHGEGRVDLDAQTARLRRTALVATAIAGAWALLFASGLAAVIAADRAAADLLATGVHAEGTVLSVEEPARGAPTMWVRYHTPGASWTEEIVRDSGRGYHEGETVTVVYDPADPAHVRTTLEANGSQVVGWFAATALVAGFLALPLAASAAWGWWRRARAVAETGWRIATVTVVPHVRRGQWIEAAYRDGSGIELRCVPSLHRPSELARRRAWVGGWGRQMVVLFPYGPDKPGPQHVPVLAAGLRA
ncbi:DUF3592 domain-containing protein [Amycolatopsis sp. Hca4]|uniref:DUF3592 domain-containing protein n=1 Tax=Amycolatopsis sp. Hca4 TaxID=2742131 RepID=UPI0015921083|nr:DUF3592 domain-containing protein [Amycolatopsis sp. Hca4]QKV79163.1 DUF3592 domain-containing protein [Amycolatopsis sp. Hca4]